MKAKTWIISWLVLVMAALFILGAYVYKVDPFMHYHKPDTSAYFYTLDNERSQNDGIVRNFDYNAIVTGTSMSENFRTTEMDEIFGMDFVKVCFSGASYKEVNDNLTRALSYNPDIKVIVRSLDYANILDPKDKMRYDYYPTYLYDDNVFNDVNYLLNKDVIFNRVYKMAVENDEEGFEPGITTFDDYAAWLDFEFGKDSVFYGIRRAKVYLEENNALNHKGDKLPGINLSEQDLKNIEENITQNVTELADRYPEVDFYYFFTPYSVMFWKILADNGEVERWLEAEQYAIELILEHDNIKLYSFNNRTDITTDLNNYKDTFHYGRWVNSIMLKWMYEGEYLLTKDNYMDYISEERSFYSNFDYSTLDAQENYANDYYAAALLNYELTGEKEPVDLLESDMAAVELQNAEIIDNQYNGSKGILCTGRLARTPGSEPGVFEHVRDKDYVGAKIKLENRGNHNYLVFYGKKIKDHGELLVFVCNEQNEKESELVTRYYELDDEWRQYVVDLSDVKGDVTIILNGGYMDNSGDKDSAFVFSDIKLY